MRNADKPVRICFHFLRDIMQRNLMNGRYQAELYAAMLLHG